MIDKGILIHAAAASWTLGRPSKPSGLECDLWSLGVMLFVVLTNEHPFCSTAPRREMDVEWETPIGENQLERFTLW